MTAITKVDILDGPSERLEDLFMIGQGGMATVHVSRLLGEAGFQKLVAVKRMRTEVAESERARLMFLDEARVAAHISSPHVVTTLDLGRAGDGSLYIVMELVLGPTLSQVLAHYHDLGEAPPLDLVVELLAQSADGLDDAHEAMTPKGKSLHIVHRDITPRNILLGLDGRVRITDFGIAQARQRLHQTEGSEIKGTFSYMSPEALRGNSVDRRADIFSLGSVSFELMTGRRLFEGKNPLEVMENVLLAEIPDPRAVRPDIPESIAAVLSKALQRDPDDRFSTARAYSDALRDAARAAVGRPDMQRVREFAASTGGAHVERINSQLVTALASSLPPPPSTGVRMEALEYTVPEVGETVTDATVPSEVRERLEKAEAAANQSKTSWKWIAAGALVVVAAGVFGWTLNQGAGVAATDPIPESRAPASSTPPSAQDQVMPALAETPTQVEPQEAAVAVSEAVDAPELEETRPSKVRPTRPRYTGAMALGRNSGGTMQRPTPAGMATSMTAMRGGLEGLDAFDAFNRSGSK